MKKCPKCNTKKPLEDFQHNRCEKDGRQSYCRECMIIAVSASKRRYSDRVREYDLEYKKKHGNAYGKLCRALRKGEVTKPTVCILCEKTIKPRLLEGHHLNYDYPLKVIWLCKSCHSTLHRREDKE